MIRGPDVARTRPALAIDLGLALGFVALDTTLTLIGGSWWPANPGALAWAMLALQALACFSLVLRRRAPLLVVGILAGFTLLVTLLISPAHLLVPAHPGNIWAPFATVLAAYAPLQCRIDRRWTYAALAVLTIVVARPWQPSVTVISIGLARIAIGPLLAMYFEARRRLIRALTERAERAEREQELLAEQARAEERARLAGEMHDVVTHR
jgi:signal transduction histidine kinase